MLAHVADNVGVVRALGEETATIVGHDWGSPIAATRRCCGRTSSPPRRC